MQVLRFVLLLAVSALAVAQSPAPVVWQMQESGTTAGLRGIFSVDGTVAWASGTGGTVLRTIDGGEHWTKCAVPDGAKDGATLDFRGVQAFDAKTAIVMASGSGDKSRLYKTVDECGTWKLVFTNKDENGFWDAIKFGSAHRLGMLLGDPVRGKFQIYATYDFGDSWSIDNQLPRAMLGENAFAASNSVFGFVNSNHFLVTGGRNSRFIFFEGPVVLPFGKVGFRETSARIPLALAPTAGAFSVAFSGEFRYWNGKATAAPSAITVGGDFSKPNGSPNTAAWSSDGGRHWTIATKPPHGYRSAVQWSETFKAWITVGTNGSDISRDDGKTWQPLDDGNWNALSLPFVVGPNGRIARMSLAAK
jgi:photosystem II stability/assembly factor-like uncharacterized protein